MTKQQNDKTTELFIAQIDIDFFKKICYLSFFSFLYFYIQPDYPLFYQILFNYILQTNISRSQQSQFNSIMQSQKIQHQTPQQTNPQPALRVHQNIKLIHHFAFQIPLPQTVTIFKYQSKNSQSKKKKKLKHKFQSFTYYQDHLSNNIYKLLFINDDTYIDQGISPFTDPDGKVKKFNQLHAKRLRTTQAAYIGHINDQLIIKKIQGVKLGQNGTQFQTVDDQFEVIKLGNEKRFSQFMKIMSLNKNSMNMSIRCIIDQTDINNPQVIDYEFFFREKQLIKKNVANKK